MIGIGTVERRQLTARIVERFVRRQNSRSIELRPPLNEEKDKSTKQSIINEIERAKIEIEKKYRGERREWRTNSGGRRLSRR